jgi:hypothetical protein
MDAVDYWRDIANRSRTEINAACEAVGAAGYYLGPYCPNTCPERLAHLRDVIADLRTALGLDDDPDTDATAKDQQQEGRGL